MICQQLKLGEYQNFSYLLADGQAKKCAVIDPSFEAEKIIAAASAKDWEIVYIINTHHHPDHTAGNELVRQAAGAAVKVVRHSKAAGGDWQVADGDKLALGSFSLEILHTPGHTEDSICILAGGHLLTGDTLFVGRVGGTKSLEAARQQFASLKRLMALDGQLLVWPGHDYGEKASSTIREERETNPFCRRLNDFAQFYWLKENWLTYKAEHGIR